MLITIRNLTTEPITAHTYPSSSSKFLCLSKDPGNVAFSSDTLSLLPCLDVTTRLPKGLRREIILSPQIPTIDDVRASNKLDTPIIVRVTDQKGSLDDKEWHIHPQGFKISFSMTFASSWRFVPVSDSCPWRVFIRRVCSFSLRISIHTQASNLVVKLTRGHHKLLILTHRDMSSFLSEMPDRLPLSSLALPGISSYLLKLIEAHTCNLGTHDTYVYRSVHCVTGNLILLNDVQNGVPWLADITVPVPFDAVDCSVHERNPCY